MPADRRQARKVRRVKAWLVISALGKRPLDLRLGWTRSDLRRLYRGRNCIVPCTITYMVPPPARKRGRR